MNTVKSWRNLLAINPFPVLLDSGNKAINYFARRDLLSEAVPTINSVWELPEVQKLLKKQQSDGSWEKPGKKAEVYPHWHHKLVETFKRFRILVERYQFTKEIPAINQAADYLFTCQTREGDIRGFIGNQYATYYTGYILALLIRAGYNDDSRIEKGMQWLLSMRQNDGG